MGVVASDFSGELVNAKDGAQLSDLWDWNRFKRCHWDLIELPDLLLPRADFSSQRITALSSLKSQNHETSKPPDIEGPHRSHTHFQNKYVDWGVAHLKEDSIKGNEDDISANCKLELDKSLTEWGQQHMRALEPLGTLESLGERPLDEEKNAHKEARSYWKTQELVSFGI